MQSYLDGQEHGVHLRGCKQQQLADRSMWSRVYRKLTHRPKPLSYISPSPETQAGSQQKHPHLRRTPRERKQTAEGRSRNAPTQGKRIRCKNEGVFIPYEAGKSEELWGIYKQTPNICFQASHTRQKLVHLKNLTQREVVEKYSTVSDWTYLFLISCTNPQRGQNKTGTKFAGCAMQLCLIAPHEDASQQNISTQ